MSTNNIDTDNERPYVDKIQDLIDLVRDQRYLTNPYYPMPTVSDSISFARTENAEALDATLRATGNYSRNHDKDELPEHEAAQSLWMTLTALVALQDYESNNYTPMPSHSKAIHHNVIACEELCYAFYEWSTETETYRRPKLDTTYYHLCQAVHHIMQEIRCYGADPLIELMAELKRVYAKHVPEPNPSDNQEE